MKYIIFNLVVAGALIYLVTGDDQKLPNSPQKAVANAETNMNHAIEDLRPQLEETASKVAEQVAREVAKQANKAQPIDDPKVEKLDIPEEDPVVAAMIHEDEILYEDPAAVNREEVPAPTEEIVLQNVKTHTISEADAFRPDNQSRPSVGNDAVIGDAEITLAEGEEMMKPRDRKRELDILAQNMELIFLSKSGN